MPSAILDANVFKVYYDELLKETEAEGHALVNALFAWGHIALDDGELIRKEWANTCCGQREEYLNEWIYGRLLENKIVLYCIDCSNQLKRAIKALGVPAKDCRLLFLAISAASEVIVSEDIHLYEPAGRDWSPQRKTAIKQNGQGCVCRHMRNTHNARVMPANLATEHFENSI